MFVFSLLQNSGVSIANVCVSYSENTAYDDAGMVILC